MALKHTDIWRAIDELARRHKLSPSGLARKAGLSPTVFNPSKRSSQKRKRWPSTESIARILQATRTTLDEFVALATHQETANKGMIPLLGYGQAGRDGYFDDSGYPTGSGWEEIHFPCVDDPHAFALEVSGKSMEPVYREGDRIVASPAERPRRGDRVVLRTAKGEVMIKQLVRATAKSVELLSLNPAFPAITLEPREIEWMYRIVWASQ